MYETDFDARDIKFGKFNKQFSKLYMSRAHQMVIREPSGSDSRSIAKNSLQRTVYPKVLILILWP